MLQLSKPLGVTQRLSLRTQLLLGFTAAYTVVFGLGLFWLYTLTRNSAIARLKTEVQSVALEAATSIPPETLAAIADGESPEMGSGQAITGSNPHLFPFSHHQLTLQPSLPLEWAIWVQDPGTRGSGAVINLLGDRPEQPSPPIPATQALTPVQHQVWIYGHVGFEPLHADGSHLWLTVYVPLKTSTGETKAILQSTVDAIPILHVSQEMGQGILLVVVVGYGVLASGIYVMAGHIRHMLNHLREIAQQMGVGKYQPTLNLVNLVFQPQEMDALAIQIQAMAKDLHDRQQVMQEAQTERDRFFNESIDLLAIFDDQGGLLQVNPAWEKTLGYTAHELVGQPFLSFVHAEDLATSTEYQQNMLQGQRQQNFIHRWRSASGDYRWLSWNCVPIPATGKYYGFARDITEQQLVLQQRQRAEQALRESETKLNVVVSSTSDGILVLDCHGQVLFANPAACKLFNHSLETLLSQTLGIPLIAGKSKAELEIVRGDGRMRVVEMSAVPTQWRGEPVHVVSVRDISDRKRAEAKLLHSAFYDSLTHLPNRAHFLKRLHNALTQAQKTPDRLFAILFIDLDHFKVVNDCLGHLAGDELLQKIGQTLKQCVPSPRAIARLGGDEFAVLLDNVQTLDHVLAVANHIQTHFQSPFRLHGLDFFISASIGIALSRHQGTGDVYSNSTDWLRDADIALYRAKSQGKARCEIFDTQMYLNVLTRLSLERDLRRALDNDELELHYQPIVSLSQDRVYGFEALVRWHHPDRGMVSPAEFIPITEETGLIIPLGAWVLRTACQQLRQWQQTGIVDRQVSISVNVASQQFAQDDLVEMIQHILQETELHPRHLRIEVTESAIAEHLDRVAERLIQLRALGVRVSIDDFGTGHSSLARLQRFPIDTLKIDRSFVSCITDATEDREFVRAIVNFAHSLGLDVVAEGVETLAQRMHLQTLGCEYGQGYLFARSLPADAVQSWLLSLVKIQTPDSIRPTLQ